MQSLLANGAKKTKISSVLCGNLSLLRCFPGTNIETWVVTSNSGDPVLHSRHCKKKQIVSNWGVEPDKAIADFVDLGRRFSERPVLFYGDDKLLLLIARNRDTFEKYYRFLMPETKLVENLVSKTQFKGLSKRFGFPVPKTLLSREVENFEDVLERITFPCILKPSSHVGWFQSKAVLEYAGGQPQKALIADSRDKLKLLYHLTEQFTDDFVIQEYIPGGESLIYSFHSYFNKNSEPLGFFVGKKLRTYPMDCGESCYLELVKEPEIVRVSLEILNKLNFVGPVKIDFKKDISRNCFYLLEINARFTLWNYLGSVSGVNLPQMAHSDLSGKHVGLQKDYKTDTKWLAFGMDIRSFLKGYYPSGGLSLRAWLSSFAGKKIYAVFAWRDPLPYIIYIANDLKTRIARMKGKLLK